MVVPRWPERQLPAPRCVTNGHVMSRVDMTHVSPCVGRLPLLLPLWQPMALCLGEGARLVFWDVPNSDFGSIDGRILVSHLLVARNSDRIMESIESRPHD